MKRFDEYMESFGRVDGWFQTPAVAIWDSLLSYQEQKGLKGNLLEIGVWKGKSAGLLALHCASEEACVLVDPLEVTEARERISAVAPEAKCYFLQHESQFLYRHPFVQETVRDFRWIHIDGEHSGQAVINDMTIANYLLNDRGILALDDFFTTAYPQVTEAAFRFLHNHQGELTLVLCGFGKAYFCRPKAAREYLCFVKSGLAAEMAERGCGDITIWKTTEPGDMNTFGITERYLGQDYRGPDWDQRSIRV